MMAFGEFRSFFFLGGTSRGIFQRSTTSFAWVVWEKPRELCEIHTEHLPNTSRELHRGGQPLGVTLNATSLHLRKCGKRRFPALKIHLAWDVTPCQLVGGYGLSLPSPTGSSSPRNIIFLERLVLKIKTLPSLVTAVTAFPSK